MSETRRDTLNRLAADAIDAAGLGLLDTDTLILAGAMLEQAAAMSRVAREVGRLAEAVERMEASRAMGLDSCQWAAKFPRLWAFNFPWFGGFGFDR